MGLENGRLRRLQQAWRNRRCEVCGRDPNAPVVYEVVWGDSEGEPSEYEDEADKYCQSCGQPVSGYTVVWDDWEDHPLYEPGYFDESREDRF